MSARSLCIIPARGGSKRLPRKNMRPFRGRPILAYAVETALAARCFEEVMVSTDESEIAQIAAAAGAAVPFLRSPASSGDTATTAAVLEEVLSGYAAQGSRFDFVCCLYPTAVLVTPSRLQEGLARLESASGADAVITVQAFSHPIERAFRVTDGFLQLAAPEHAFARQQDLPPAYHDAGQFYWLRTAAFLKHRAIFLPAALPLPLAEWEAQDINTEDDWRLAEWKWRLARGLDESPLPG